MQKRNDRRNKRGRWEDFEGTLRFAGEEFRGRPGSLGYFTEYVPAKTLNVNAEATDTSVIDLSHNESILHKPHTEPTIHRESI
jgi:hypothetical protein